MDLKETKRNDTSQFSYHLLSQSHYRHYRHHHHQNLPRLDHQFSQAREKLKKLINVKNK
jgi:selenocysteine lyase/cysteine desulfurase